MIELPTIIKDTREKSGYSFRKSNKCAGMVMEKLDTGDYSIKGLEHIICIERKSVSDLYNTLSPAKKNVANVERFSREVERMCKIPYRYIVIDGTINDVMKGSSFSKLNPEYIRSQLYELQLIYGIHVVFLGKGQAGRDYVRTLLIKTHSLYHEGKLSIDV